MLQYYLVAAPLLTYLSGGTMNKEDGGIVVDLLEAGDVVKFLRIVRKALRNANPQDWELCLNCINGLAHDRFAGEKEAKNFLTHLGKAKESIPGLPKRKKQRLIRWAFGSIRNHHR